MFFKPVKLLFSYITLLSTLIILPVLPALSSEDLIPTISTSGTGEISIAPDTAILSFGVLREAKTARGALDENNKAMAAVLNALKENGIADKDLQTSGFNIQPRYFYPKRKANGEQPQPQITGYAVSNNLTVRILNLDKAGEILDLVVTLGVNSGGNIRFTNSDTSSILKEARTKAVKDAVTKANTLADAAGVKLGSILSINENANSVRPVALANARALRVQEDASVPIASGENTYKINVHMSWNIVQ